MATIKLAEEFEQWASQFVDMGEARQDVPTLSKEEVQKISEGYCDKDGNMDQHDWEEFANVIQGALSEKIVNYFRGGGVKYED